MNKNIPIVFTFDKRIVLGAAVAIKSLIETANDDTVYDIYVFHPDIDDKTILCFEKMLANTQHKISFEFIDKSRFKHAPINKGGSWTEIVYYRLLIAELLPQYDCVIYSDVDVLFMKDMREVYELNLCGYEFAAVRAERNSSEMIGHKYFKENDNEFIYWSGFIVMNTKLMRENEFVDRCFDVINTYNDRLKFFDLDTLNLVSSKIKDVPFDYCTLQSVYYLDNLSESEEYEYIKNVYTDEELLYAKENPAIVHYAGKPGKPWRMPVPYSDYQEYIVKVPSELRKYTLRDYKKKFLAKVKGSGKIKS
ncbi:glycosyltransferase family 8 protein [Francisella sp. Scap27]|uniref:glycosyltransferase family 8 protein n=1 Tax=Francisella sp. Scap27 TaxID=2589986 RepID=UPI0015BA0FB6|nr:glycosyltransferase family 8 protein [Francisella sp. Scap27]QLE78950.1 glycosyltransferase family 8 protein [Francisella sp. Scap27]